MKRIVASLMVVGLVLVLLGCQPTQTPPAGTAPAPTGGPEAVSGPAAPAEQAQPSAEQPAAGQQEEAA